MEEAHRTGIRGHAVRDCLLHTRYPAQHTLSQSVVLLLLHPPHVVVLLLVLHMLFAFEIHIFTLQQRVHYSSGFLCSQTSSSSSVDDCDGDYDGGTVTAKVKTRHAVFTLLHYIFSVAAVLYLCRVHFTETVHGLNDFRALTSLCTTTILGGWDV